MLVQFKTEQVFLFCKILTMVGQNLDHFFCRITECGEKQLGSNSCQPIIKITIFACLLGPICTHCHTTVIQMFDTFIEISMIS